MDQQLVREIIRQLSILIVSQEIHRYLFSDELNTFIDWLHEDQRRFENPDDSPWSRGFLYVVQDNIAALLGKTPQKEKQPKEDKLPTIKPRTKMNTRQGGKNIAAQRKILKDIEERRRQGTYGLEEQAEDNADDYHAANAGQDANVEQLQQVDEEIDPMRAPNGPGVQGATASRDYPMMQRAVQKGCQTTCRYERVFEHVVPIALVNAPNCHLSLVLASVVQGDAVNCNSARLSVGRLCVQSTDTE